MREILVTEWMSPVGELILGSVDGKLCLCDWANSRLGGRSRRRVERMLDGVLIKGSSEIIDRVIRQLQEYFAGERRTFDIPILMAGTEFQLKVWEELQHISYGEREGYSEIARRISNPKSVRAVANAVGANALSIIVPCHRVVRTDGKPSDYAGGMPAKVALLELEAAQPLSFPHKTTS